MDCLLHVQSWTNWLLADVKAKDGLQSAAQIEVVLYAGLQRADHFAAVPVEVALQMTGQLRAYQFVPVQMEVLLQLAGL